MNETDSEEVIDSLSEFMLTFGDQVTKFAFEFVK